MRPISVLSGRVQTCRVFALRPLLVEHCRDLARRRESTYTRPADRGPLKEVRDHHETSFSSRSGATPRNNADGGGADTFFTQATSSSQPSVPGLYAHLLDYAKLGRIQRVRQIVDYLIENRNEKPNARLYNALIMVNVNADQGSCEEVGHLLRELEQEEIPLDTAICHSVLKVLSVHPDHLLRADILDHMRRQWITLSTDGKIDIAAGYLREGQVGFGLTILSELRQEAVLIPGWLNDLAVYTLLQLEHLDDAVDYMVERRMESINDIGVAMWQHMLDVVSEAHHYAGTLFVWTYQVRNGLIVTSIGTLQNVLATAAQHGDKQLANEAVRELVMKGVDITLTEYEQLCQAHLVGDKPDVSGALAVLFNMPENKSSAKTVTRPIYLAWHRRPELVDEAFWEMKRHRDEGGRVPIPVLNTLLEIHDSKQDADGAMQVYDSMHTFVHPQAAPGPRESFADTETFALMYSVIQHASKDRFELAMYIAAEQDALKISFDLTCYRHLIRICIACQRVEEAISLREACVDQGLTLDNDVAERLDEEVRRRDENSHQLLPGRPKESW